MQSKTFADASQDTYGYNARGQLSGVTEPGISASSFAYDKAGELTSSSYTDSTTGPVVSAIDSFDELGRPVVSAATDNGRTFTTIDTYTAQGELLKEQSTATGATLTPAYYPTTNTPSTGSPGALQSLTVTPPAGAAAATARPIPGPPPTRGADSA